MMAAASTSPSATSTAMAASAPFSSASHLREENEKASYRLDFFEANEILSVEVTNYFILKVPNLSYPFTPWGNFGND